MHTLCGRFPADFPFGNCRFPATQPLIFQQKQTFLIFLAELCGQRKRFRLLYDHNKHTMKTKITNQDSQQEKPFPKLMIDVGGDIHLMTRYGAGIVVYSDCDKNVGLYDTDWDMSELKDFSGEVVISND